MPDLKDKIKTEDIIAIMKKWEQVGWKDDGGFLGVRDGDYASIAKDIGELFNSELKNILVEGFSPLIKNEKEKL